MMLFGVLTIFTVNVLAVAAHAQLFSKRPGTLSTTVQFSPYDPVTFQIIINGQQLVGRRSSRLGDTGSTPYKSVFQKSLTVELNWIESFSQKAYTTKTVVPVGTLSRIDAKGDHASIFLSIGRNGALEIATPHPELNRFIREDREDEITPEMDELVELKQVCGDPVPKNAANYAKMLAWLDDFSMRDANKFRQAALKRDPNGQSLNPCG